MSTLYSAKATAVAGRSSTADTDDGLLNLQLAPPPAMGGKGGATNPEQLFAAGYSACFGNAVIRSTHKKDVKLLKSRPPSGSDRTPRVVSALPSCSM